LRVNSGSLLDSTTVTKANFTLTAGDGATIPVKDVTYYSNAQEVALYPATTIVPQDGVCLVESDSLLDPDGQAVSISQTASVLTENECALFDMSVKNLQCYRNNVPVYGWLAEGTYTAQATVINTAATEKTKNLVVYKTNINNQTSVLYRLGVTLQPEEERIVTFSFNANSGDRVEATME